MATQSLNRVAEAHGARLHLTPIDLESCALHDAGADLLGAIAAWCGSAGASREQSLHCLESRKASYPRTKVAATMAWSTVSDYVLNVPRCWFAGAMSQAEADKLLDRGKDWKPL